MFKPELQRIAFIVLSNLQFALSVFLDQIREVPSVQGIPVFSAAEEDDGDAGFFVFLHELFNSDVVGVDSVDILGGGSDVLFGPVVQEVVVFVESELVPVLRWDLLSVLSFSLDRVAFHFGRKLREGGWESKL